MVGCKTQRKKKKKKPTETCTVYPSICCYFSSCSLYGCCISVSLHGSTLYQFDLTRCNDVLIFGLWQFWNVSSVVKLLHVCTYLTLFLIFPAINHTGTPRKRKTSRTATDTRLHTHTPDFLHIKKRIVFQTPPAGTALSSWLPYSIRPPPHHGPTSHRWLSLNSSSVVLRSSSSS